MSLIGHRANSILESWHGPRGAADMADADVFSFQWTEI